MKRLIALDMEEYNALVELSLAANSYVPLYKTLSLSQGLYYVFDSEGSGEIEKMILLSACAELKSP